MRRQVVLLLGALALLASPLALACGGATSSVHMGGLMSVDAQSQTFTILDVESGSPITFTGDSTMIKSLQGRQGFVQVSFSEEDGRLTATDVRF